jgi:ferritin
MIEEELHDSEKYIDCALYHKDSDRELADLFYALSGEEMDHMERLHAQVVRIIKEFRAKNGEPPENMKAVYDYLHEQQIDHASKINIKRSMYRG